MTTSTPDIAGRFAIYMLSDGSAKMVYQLVGEEEKTATIPAFMVALVHDVSIGKAPLGYLIGMLGM